MKKYNMMISFSIAIAALAASPAFPGGLEISPETVDIGDMAEGETFSVDIVAIGVEDLGAFEFDIRYDGAVVHAKEVAMGDFLGSGGRPVESVGPIIDNNQGVVRTGAFSMGDSAGPDGKGALSTVTFEVRSKQTASLSLDNVILTDASANVMAADDVKGGHLRAESSSSQALNDDSDLCFISIAWKGN